MNPQLNSAAGQENIHELLEEGQMLKQEIPLQVQGNPQRTEQSPRLSLNLTRSMDTAQKFIGEQL